MTNVDQFESVFKSADKAAFAHRPPELRKVLVATDLDVSGAEAIAERTKDFLSHLANIPGPFEFELLTGDSFDSVGELLDCVEAARPDLIVTYRNLKSDAWKWPFSLGEYLDVLLQAMETPVLVLPRPDENTGSPPGSRDTDQVMAMTDNLAGDDRLVNAAFAFTADKGTCWLTHVEDATVFEHYMTAIGKIPEIDTETARTTIANRLQKGARDYIQTCRAKAEELGLGFAVEEVVVQGQHVAEYKRLVEDHDIGLLILYTKNDDHLAMHGVAYPLAIEMRHTPLLML